MESLTGEIESWSKQRRERTERAHSMIASYLPRWLCMQKPKRGLPDRRGSEQSGRASERPAVKGVAGFEGEFQPNPTRSHPSITHVCVRFFDTRYTTYHQLVCQLIWFAIYPAVYLDGYGIADMCMRVGGGGGGGGGRRRGHFPRWQRALCVSRLCFVTRSCNLTHVPAALSPYTHPSMHACAPCHSTESLTRASGCDFKSIYFTNVKVDYFIEKV